MEMNQRWRKCMSCVEFEKFILKLSYESINSIIPS